MVLKTLLSAFVISAAVAAETLPSPVTILPGKAHEDCRMMTAGQAVSYSYTAGAPLDFNVHYHEGYDVFYLAQEAMSLASAGSVVSPAETEICLMWTNGINREPVTLEYKSE